MRAPKAWVNILVFSNATAAQRRWTKTFTAKNTYIKCQFPGDSIRRALPIAVDAHADMERVVCVGGGSVFLWSIGISIVARRSPQSRTFPLQCMDRNKPDSVSDYNHCQYFHVWAGMTSARWGWHAWWRDSRCREQNSGTKQDNSRKSVA